MSAMSELIVDEPIVCAKCQGTGFELVEGRGVRECACAKEKKVREWIEASRIPPRFAHARFENYEATTPNLQRALQHSRRFVEQYPEDHGLLYLGNPGVGKTHLAVSALRALIEKGHSGLFYDFNDLLKEIQDSYSDEKKTSELAILKPIFNTEILVLDELGATKPTEWVRATMTHIINRRYNERRVTVFTSNYLDAPSVGTVSDESLTDRIGARFRSRLHEMCRLIFIEAPDFREVIRIRRGGKPRIA